MFLARRLLFVSLVWLTACGGGDPAPGPGGEREAGPEAPVLVFGVDGLEWSVLLPLVQAGEMPTVRSLMESGTWGELETLVPTKSPRLWTTIATGKPPEEHGILGFVIKPEHPGESMRQYTSRDRRVKAHWNILGDYGVRSDTLGWWTTWPAEKVLGTMIAQTNSLANARTNPKGTLVDGKPAQVWPPEMEGAVFDALREAEAGLDEHMDAIFGPVGGALDARRRIRWEQCRWSFRADRTYLAVLGAKLDREPPTEVTSIYLGGADVSGHRFWAAYDPASFRLADDSLEPLTFGHVIPAYYRYLDRALADLLRRFPVEPTVLIVSDHGMGPVPELAAQGPAADLEKFTGGHKTGAPGLLIAAGPGIARATSERAIDEYTRDSVPRVGHILDVCPTLLALCDVPFGEDMGGRPLTNVLTADFVREHAPRSVATHDDVDWLTNREGRLDAAESDERLDQLRNLGYLGDVEQDDGR